MQIQGFHDMYLAELQELRNAALQQTIALQEMADTATNPSLSTTLEQLCEESAEQKERLDKLLEKHRVDPRAHVDQAMQSIVRETEKMIRMLRDDGLRDAALIVSAQKAKHYEIAAYGTAAALADELGLAEDRQLLCASLAEEKRADALLTDVAKREVNAEASGT
jgi:ferritin-like metal-binding protein YciE